MRYWPVSLVFSSPILNGVYKLELSRMSAARPLSRGAWVAICQCVDAMPTNISPLTLAPNEDGRTHFVYLGPPTMEDWLRLERKIFVLHNGDFGLSVDTLH